MTKFILSILLFFLFQFSLHAFNGEKRLSKKNIVAIHSNEDASLILNDSSGNIFNYNGDEVNQIEFENNIDSPTIIHSNKNNIVLFSNANSLFLKQDGNAVKEILTAPKFESIVRVVQNKDYYFVSTKNGLYQIEKSSNEVTEIYKNNIEKTNRLICGAKDCYLAIKNIVINLSKNEVVEHNLPSNISSIEYHKEHGIITLCEDRVFVSSKDGSKKLFPIIGEFPPNINDIYGSDRWLFLITDHSVSVFDWLNSEVKQLGEFSGYPVSKHIDQWDNLWLATNQGLWNFSGYNSFNSPRIFDVKLTDKNNKTLSGRPLDFNSETSLVNITPEIIYLPNTEKLKNEWRLKDGNWRSFVKDFALSEKMLVDGTNILFIRSKSNESAYSLPYKLEINNSVNSSKIAPIWYATFGLIGSLLLVSLISLFNIRSKQNESSLLIEKLKAENALLQSKQQIDQLQMNPHFIFNALNSINGLIASGKTSESRKAISLFSKFLRQFLYQSQGEDIVLEEEINLLENYVKIEQVCRDGKFNFKSELNDDSLLDVKLPNMIIQPFIENAIIHAFPNPDQKGEIKLEIKEENGYLVALIKDNGVGIKDSAVKKDHKSIAIDLVRKRLAQRDKNRRKIYLEYLDNNPGTVAKIYLKRL